MRIDRDGDILGLLLITVPLLFVIAALAASVYLFPEARRTLASPRSLRVIAWLQSTRWWVRGLAVLFIPLWIFAAHYDIGWRTSQGEYLMLTRGMAYAIHREGVFGLAPWWERDLVWTFRPLSFGPTLSTGLDLYNDGTGFGISLGLAALFLTLLSFMPALVRRIVLNRRFEPGRCRACGYHLTGLTTAKCPECGEQDASR
jgi:hypothetical protein